jgi:hypothetical protein
VSGCCECGDEPSGSCAMELVKCEHSNEPLCYMRGEKGGNFLNR